MAAATRGVGWPVGLLLLCLSCSSEPANPGAPSGPASSAVRVLMLTATAGFRHDSIATARQTLTNLGATSGFTITATEDLSAVSASSLAGYDVLFFALTSGELAFTAEQKAAMLAFVSKGGGFMGAHSATDTLYDWPGPTPSSAHISGSTRGRRRQP